MVQSKNVGISCLLWFPVATVYIMLSWSWIYTKYSVFYVIIRVHIIVDVSASYNFCTHKLANGSSSTLVGQSPIATKVWLLPLEFAKKQKQKIYICLEL